VDEEEEEEEEVVVVRTSNLELRFISKTTKMIIAADICLISKIIKQANTYTPHHTHTHTNTYKTRIFSMDE
jgi:hypothetical protein